MRSIRSRLTYANVVASLALFISVGGGSAYAVQRLQANSVGTEQLQANAVTSSKVLDGSLLATDFKAGQIPAGPQGIPGPAGGLSGLEVIYAPSGDGPATVKSSAALCPAGKKVTGGGSLITGSTNARVVTSTPGQVQNPTSWYVEAKDTSATGGNWTVYAYAVCATAG